jgi:hypothetical protein
MLFKAIAVYYSKNFSVDKMHTSLLIWNGVMYIVYAVA